MGRLSLTYLVEVEPKAQHFAEVALCWGHLGLMAARVVAVGAWADETRPPAGCRSVASSDLGRHCNFLAPSGYQPSLLLASGALEENGGLPDAVALAFSVQRHQRSASPAARVCAPNGQ